MAMGVMTAVTAATVRVTEPSLPTRYLLVTAIKERRSLKPLKLNPSTLSMVTCILLRLT